MFQKTFLTIMKTYMSMVIMYTVVTAIPRNTFKSLKERKVNTIDECKEVMTQERGGCHTIHIKDCTITMKTVVTPVKVKKCMTKTRGDEGKCVGGVRKTCKIR